MAVISFAEGRSDAAWVVAGWAFRQLLADVLGLHPDDVGLATMFERAEAVGYLTVHRLDKPLAGEVATQIKDTTEGILAGKIRSGVIDRFSDPHTTAEYLKGIKMLLDAVRAAEDC